MHPSRVFLAATATNFSGANLLEYSVNLAFLG